MIDSEGFEIRPRFMPERDIADLVTAVQQVDEQGSARAGRRNLAETVPEIAALQAESPIQTTASEILGAPAFCVRTLFFDKTAATNWKVAWHQDLTICVKNRRDVPGFGPWSSKDGVDHVQPPATVLERMITLRLHLDDCSAENGALRVLPRTHIHGRLSPVEIQESRERIAEVTCELPAGGLLLMRPLLLHASSRRFLPGIGVCCTLNTPATPCRQGLNGSAETGTFERCATPRVSHSYPNRESTLSFRPRPCRSCNRFPGGGEETYERAVPCFRQTRCRPDRAHHLRRWLLLVY